MRGACRVTLKSAVDDRGYFAIRIGELSSTTRTYFPKAVGALFAEAPTPKRDCLEVDLEILGNDLVLPSIGGC